MAALGLCCCIQAFSSCNMWAIEHAHFSRCGSRAQLSCGMWNLPIPGTETVSPALAGRFLTIGLPGKSIKVFLCPTFLGYRKWASFKPPWSLLSPSSVQFSQSVVSNSLRPPGLQHARPPCPSPTPRPCSNSCPLSQWCHPTISSSVISFSSCLQSLPGSGSFPVSLFFASGGQNIGASVSVLPMNIQDWFPVELTGLISLLLFKGSHKGDKVKLKAPILPFSLVSDC